MGSALISFVQWRNDFTLRPHLPAIRARELSRTQQSLPVLKRIEDYSSHQCNTCNHKNNNSERKKKSKKVNKKEFNSNNYNLDNLVREGVVVNCSNEKCNEKDDEEDEENGNRSALDKESVMNSRGNAIIVESAHHDMLYKNEEVGNRFSKCTHYTIPGEEIESQSIKIRKRQMHEQDKINEKSTEEPQFAKMSEFVNADDDNRSLHKARSDSNTENYNENEESRKCKDNMECMCTEDENELGPWDCVDGVYHLTSSSSFELYRRLDSATYRASHVASLDDASWFARYQNGLKYINATHLPHSTGFLWDYKTLASRDSSFVSLTRKMQQVCAQPELIHEEAIGWRGVNHVEHKVNKTSFCCSSKLSGQKSRATVPQSTNDNLSSSSSSSNVMFYMNPAQYWTYNELWNKIILFASGLHFLGIRPGSFVMILDDNRWEWLVSCHACWVLGAIVLTSPCAKRSLLRLAEDTLYDSVQLVIGQEHYVDLVQRCYKEAWRQRERELNEVEVSKAAMSKILDTTMPESETATSSLLQEVHYKEKHKKSRTKLNGHIPKAIITSSLLQNATEDYSNNDCKENSNTDKHKATKAALWWSDVIAFGERQLLQPWYSTHKVAFQHSLAKPTKSHKYNKESNEIHKEKNVQEKQECYFTGELYPLRASDLAMIVYTEGDAKGVTLTHGALVASATGYLLSFQKMQLNEKEYNELESEMFEEEEQEELKKKQAHLLSEEEQQEYEDSIAESRRKPQLERRYSKEIGRKNSTNSGENYNYSERSHVHNSFKSKSNTTVVSYHEDDLNKDDATRVHKYKNIIKSIYSSSAMRYLKVTHRFLSALLKPIHASSFLNYWSQRRCEMNALSSRHHFSSLPALSFLPNPISSSSPCMSTTNVPHTFYKSELQYLQHQQQNQQWHKRRRRQWEWNSEHSSYQRPTLLTYQSLHHVMELIMQNVFLFQGYLVCFGSKATLLSVQVHPCGDLSCFRPQLFTTSPNFLSQLKYSIETSIEPGYRQLLFDVGYEARQVALRRQLETPFLNSFIFRQLRTLLGGKCKLILSTHASLEANVQEFMQVVCGVSVIQCYSSNVLAGSGLMQYYWSNELNSIGHLCDGALEVKLRPCNGYSSEESNGGNNNNVLCGELLLRGPAMMSGYYRQEEVTAYEMENYYTDVVYINYNDKDNTHICTQNNGDDSNEANSEYSFNNVITTSNHKKMCVEKKCNNVCGINGGWWHSGDIVERRSHGGFRVIDRLLQPPSYALYETNLESHQTEKQFHTINNSNKNNVALYPTLATHTISVNPVGRVGKCKLSDGHTICLPWIELAYEEHPLALAHGVCVIVHPHCSLLCALVLTSETKIMEFIHGIRGDNHYHDDNYYYYYDDKIDKGKSNNNINNKLIRSNHERTKELYKLLSKINEQNLRWPFVLREAALHKAASYSFYHFGKMHLCHTSPFFLAEHEFICHVRLLYDEWTTWNKCRTRTGRINREVIASRYEGVIAELFADMLKSSNNV